MIALDTNIFIYILEKNSQYYQACRQLFVKAEQGDEQLCASELVLAEVLSSARLSAKEVKQCQDFITSGLVILQPLSREVIVKAAAIRRQHPRLRLPDALHLASSLAAGAKTFVTNDKTLLAKAVLGIKIVDLEQGTEYTQLREAKK